MRAVLYPDGGSPYVGYASTRGDNFVMWTEAPTAANFHFLSGHFADLGKSVAAGFGRGNGSVFGSGVGEPFVAIPPMNSR